MFWRWRWDGAELAMAGASIWNSRSVYKEVALEYGAITTGDPLYQLEFRYRHFLFVITRHLTQTPWGFNGPEISSYLNGFEKNFLVFNTFYCRSWD